MMNGMKTRIEEIKGFDPGGLSWNGLGWDWDRAEHHGVATRNEGAFPIFQQHRISR